VRGNLLKIVFLTILFFSSARATSNAQADNFPWEGKRKSEHFIVYYQSAPLGYIDEILNWAEKYYNDINNEFGFIRIEDFWTWDKRTKIFLFKDKNSFRAVVNHPEWSAGEVKVITREIYTYVNMGDFFEAILPHELGHIVFREFVGYKKKLPLWLDEGVVCFLEKNNRAERLMVVKKIVSTRSFMPISELNDIKRNSIFMPEIFYAESSSIMQFLMTVYGKEKFLVFCRMLKAMENAGNWELALKSAYGIENIQDLNDKWVKFLKSN